MRLLLFTKNHDEYSPFINVCIDKFDDVLIVSSDRNTSHIQGISCLFHQFKKSKNYNSLIEKIIDFKPDLLISFCYNRIIHDDILAISPINVNFHGSLLPNYAGAHALNWQIINGEKQSGVTIHELSSIVDGGRIALQEKFSIHIDDDANDVLKKLISTSVSVFNKFFKSLEEGSLVFKDQELLGNEFNCTLRKPEDGELTSDMSASQVYNMCRALAHPWPGVFYVNPETSQKIIIDTKIDMKKAKDIVKILRSA